MTGGISMGVKYFGTSVGSRVPPGIAAYALNILPPKRVVRYNPAPAAAPSLRKPRLLTMIKISSYLKSIVKMNYPPLTTLVSAWDGHKVTEGFSANNHWGRDTSFVI
jgi:hypothetical protein